MKLILPVRKLSEELSLANGVVEKKGTIPILANVLLVAKDGENPVLELTATDLELGLHTSCHAEVEEPGTVAVPIQRLYEYVRLLPDAELSIVSEGIDSISLQCGSAKTRIAGVDPENFPALTQMPEELATVATEPLLSAVKRTIISVATEQSHYALAGGLLVIGPESVGFVSTDGHRLSVFLHVLDGVSSEEETRVILPRKAMAELQKVLQVAEGSGDASPLVTVATDANNVYFRSGKRLFISRRVTGKFPKYERVLPKDLEILLELDVAKFGAVLRRVAQFSDDRSRAVRFTLKDGKLHMAAAVSHFGSSEESLLVEYEGNSVSVGFNAQYIIDFLGVCGSEKILMRLQDARSACQLEIPGLAEGADCRYVIMPIRV